MKIAILTSTRADFTLLKNLIYNLKITKKLDTKVICTGSHFSKKHGLTFNEIKENQIEVDKKIILSNKNSSRNLIKDGNLLSTKIAKYFIENKIELLIVLGDRFEILHSVLAAYLCRVKIAHIHGGEVTHGSLDDGIRHAITKLSDYHFVAHKDYKKRIIQLGEKKENIFIVGGLGAEAITKTILINKISLSKILKIDFKKKTALVCVQPETNNIKNTKKIIIETLSAISEFKDITFIFTAPGVDLGSSEIVSKIKRFIKKNKNCSFFNSLGGKLYYSMMKQVDFIIGNSSSGILEMPSFNKPTINIGKRQSGRIFSKSILSVGMNRNLIKNAIKKTIKSKNIKYINPYKKPKTSEKIISIIKNIKINNENHKKFRDIKFN